MQKVKDTEIIGLMRGLAFVAVMAGLLGFVAILSGCTKTPAPKELPLCSQVFDNAAKCIDDYVAEFNKDRTGFRSKICKLAGKRAMCHPTREDIDAYIEILCPSSYYRDTECK